MPGNCICSQTTPWIAIFLLVAGLNHNTISSQFHTIYSQKRKTTRRADIQKCHDQNSRSWRSFFEIWLIQLAQLVLQPSPATFQVATFSCGSCWNLKHASDRQADLGCFWIYMYEVPVPERSPWDDLETKQNVLLQFDDKNRIICQESSSMLHERTEVNQWLVAILLVRLVSGSLVALGIKITDSQHWNESRNPHVMYL